MQHSKEHRVAGQVNVVKYGPWIVIGDLGYETREVKVGNVVKDLVNHFGEP